MVEQLRDAIATAGRVVWQVVVSFRYNWGIGILAVVLAVSLWVFVTGQDDPEVTGRVPGSIPVECVNVPLGKADAPPCLETKSVTVRVRAPESVLDGLSADDFSAFVDLSGVTTDQVSLPVRIETDEARVDILEISPSQVIVQLEDVTFRTVTVRAKLVGTPPQGFEAGDLTVFPEAAIVTGATSLVNRVEAVEVDVDLTGRRTSFDRTLILQARDAQGGNVLGVNIEPGSAQVSAEIEQLEFSSALVVQPEIDGLPAAGFSISAIEVEPAIVNVTGPALVFQALDPIGGVPTAPVSIDGASADVVRPVTLQLPEGASVDQPQVTVRVVIVPTAARLTFSVPLATANVPSNLTATLDAATVRVTLAGPLSSLAGVTAGDIDATVDLGGLGAGEHTVRVEVDPPAGLATVSAVPAEVLVSLSAR